MLWDLEKNEQIKVLKGHRHFVYTAIFNINGKTLISGSEDKTLKLWK